MKVKNIETQTRPLFCKKNPIMKGPGPIPNKWGRKHCTSTMRKVDEDKLLVFFVGGLYRDQLLGLGCACHAHGRVDGLDMDLVGHHARAPSTAGGIYNTRTHEIEIKMKSQQNSAGIYNTRTDGMEIKMKVKRTHSGETQKTLISNNSSSLKLHYDQVRKIHLSTRVPNWLKIHSWYLW